MLASQQPVGEDKFVRMEWVRQQKPRGRIWLAGQLLDVTLPEAEEVEE